MYHLERGMSQYDPYDIFAHKLVTCSKSHQRSMILSSSFGITCPSSGRIEIFQNQKSLNYSDHIHRIFKGVFLSKNNSGFKE